MARSVVGVSLTLLLASAASAQSPPQSVYVGQETDIYLNATSFLPSTFAVGAGYSNSQEKTLKCTSCAGCRS